MIDETTIQTSIMSRLKDLADGSNFDLYAEGGPPVDFVSRTRGFVIADVVIDETYKASIEPGAGVRRYEGYLALGIFVKGGEGVGLINEFKTQLNEQFMSQYLDEVLMKDSANMKPREIPGWFGRGVQYGFCADNLPV